MVYITDEQRKKIKLDAAKWAKSTRERLGITFSVIEDELQMFPVRQIRNWEDGHIGPQMPLYIEYLVDMNGGKCPQKIKRYFDLPEVKKKLEWFYSDGYVSYMSRKHAGVSRCTLANDMGVGERVIRRIENDEWVPKNMRELYFKLINARVREGETEDGS